MDANSRALAAVKAAVQQDHSRTAASRTWWPFCFDTSAAAAMQQQGQHAGVASMLAAPGQQQQQQLQAGIPSTGLPWWSPGTGANKLQRWFGLDLFVLLQPASYSRRFLDAAESSSLLSVARLALSSAGVAWPLLLPVHDALRDAYIGAAQVCVRGWGIRRGGLHSIGVLDAGRLQLACSAKGSAKKACTQPSQKLSCWADTR